ncbi:MAG: PilZ domain [Myxococcaceae bacterium]|nr:PilZ domain [Myxococcaceae bacterium]
MTSKDKRRYPRVHAKNVSAHLNVADQSSPCVIQNISAGGIFIETAEALPVGMPVAVNLARPGWTKVLRLSGRVVWAMAARTAAKKGQLPGMRIKFDASSQASAADLMTLLMDLGAVDSPPPLMLAEEEVRKKLPKDVTQPVSLREIQARVSQLDPPPSNETMPAKNPIASTITSPAYKPPAPQWMPQPSAPRPGSSAPRFQVAPVGGATSDSPRLIVQVQGLLMQMGDLQQQLEQREKELNVLRERLKVKEEALDKSDRERKAAELAIQRLAMQLASRR